MKKLAAAAALAFLPLIFSIGAFAQQSEPITDSSKQTENTTSNSFQNTDINYQDIVSDKDMAQMENDVSADKLNTADKKNIDFLNAQDSKKNEYLSSQGLQNNNGTAIQP